MIAAADGPSRAGVSRPNARGGPAMKQVQKLQVRFAGAQFYLDIDHVGGKDSLAATAEQVTALLLLLDRTKGRVNFDLDSKGLCFAIQDAMDSNIGAAPPRR